MRILFVTTRPPWPGRRGDQARVQGLVSMLAPRHRIHIVAQSWPGFVAEAVPPRLAHCPSSSRPSSSPASPLASAADGNSTDLAPVDRRSVDRRSVDPEEARARIEDGHEIGASLETVPIGRARLLTALVTGAARWAGGELLDRLSTSDRPSSTVRRPLQVDLYRHRPFRRAVLRAREQFRPDVVVLCLSRLGDLVDLLAEADTAQPTPIVLDLVDALSLNMEQRSRREPWLRWLWRGESRRFARWDRYLARRVARATVVAERDRQALLSSSTQVDAGLVDALRVLPFGVRLSAEGPELGEARARPGASDGTSDGTSDGASDGASIVALTGNLGYFPTVDGAAWFAREVWPRVRGRAEKEGLAVRWLLAGARPAESVLRLAELPGVEVVANPDDLRALARRAAVSIAPLRSGSGTPIKILEAMADGVPVVTTPEGADGLDQLPAGAIRIASSAEDFAEQVLEALERPDPQRARLAWEWLDRRHRLERTAEAFERLLEEVVEEALVDAGDGR